MQHIRDSYAITSLGTAYLTIHELRHAKQSFDYLRASLVLREILILHALTPGLSCSDLQRVVEFALCIQSLTHELKSQVNKARSAILKQGLGREVFDRDSRKTFSHPTIVTSVLDNFSTDEVESLLSAYVTCATLIANVC